MKSYYDNYWFLKRRRRRKNKKPDWKNAKQPKGWLSGLCWVKLDCQPGQVGFSWSLILII